MKTLKQQIEHKLALKIPEEIILRNPMLRKYYSQDQNNEQDKFTKRMYEKCQKLMNLN